METLIGGHYLQWDCKWQSFLLCLQELERAFSSLLSLPWFG